jgi:hypothetical protein
MPRKLTGFERMWNAYPAPNGEVPEVKRIIGGAIDADWLTNTCVVRLCRAMNYAGHPIPQGFPGLSTVSGADGMRYAYRLEEFRNYLIGMYGPARFREEHEPPRAEVPASFKGQRGIIGFRVRGWTDATGHIDLWDGERPAHAEYFALAYSLELWCVASSGEPLLAPGTAPVPISASVGRDGVNKSEDVARVQALLDARGFDPGAADGLIGPRTLGALADFQKRFLTVADGRVDPNGRTWRELNGL